MKTGKGVVLTSEIGKNAWDRAVIEQNQRWLLSYMHSLVGHPEDARDLTQQVFFVAVKNQDKFDGEHPLGAWLRGIARNVARQYWQKKGRVPVLLEDGVLEQLDYCASLQEGLDGDGAYHDSRVKALKECLLKLSSRLRKMFHLKYAEALDSKAIGKLFSMRENTVNKTLSRGRRTLALCVQTRIQQFGYE